MKHVLVLCLLFVGGTFSSDLRDGRWFNKQTKTVVRTFKTSRVVVESTPSSCVVVESNLPPCRHLRSFWPFVSATKRITETKAPSFHKAYDEPVWKPVPSAVPSNKPTPPLTVKSSGEPIVNAGPPVGWDWDIFNFAPKEITVTKTIEQVHTTKVFDPNTVVTFSVKGCRPSRLPFDLSECKPPQPSVTEPVPERSVIVMAPVQFVPPLESSVLPQSLSQPLPQPLPQPLSQPLPQSLPQPLVQPLSQPPPQPIVTKVITPKEGGADISAELHSSVAV